MSVYTVYDLFCTHSIQAVLKLYKRISYQSKNKHSKRLLYKNGINIPQPHKQRLELEYHVIIAYIPIYKHIHNNVK